MNPANFPPRWLQSADSLGVLLDTAKVRAALGIRPSEPEHRGYVPQPLPPPPEIVIHEYRPVSLFTVIRRWIMCKLHPGPWPEA